MGGCPSCFTQMAVVPIGTPDAPLHVDVCRACHVIWFDSGEEAQLPSALDGRATVSAAAHLGGAAAGAAAWWLARMRA